MGLQFFDLDEITRPLMASEIDTDANGAGVYLSSYLNQTGEQNWAGLLRRAAVDGNDDQLAANLNAASCFKVMTIRNTKKGPIDVRVPVTAATTLSESQFNMYYMRALALRAISEGKRLLVYRAKAVENPRQESEQIIGTYLDPHLVLEVLRRTKGVEPEIGIPMPNSGLCVQLV